MSIDTGETQKPKRESDESEAAAENRPPESPTRHPPNELHSEKPSARRRRAQAIRPSRLRAIATP